MATKKKLKAPAQEHVPADRDACAAQITAIGILQRESERLAAEMNDQVAKITDHFAPLLADLAERVKALQAGVQTWCEANRAALTGDHKVKFHNFLTGTVTWRTGLDSVSVTNAEAVLLTLKALKLPEFIRTKEEVNKDAVLANFSAAAKITADQVNAEADEVQKALLIRTLECNSLLQGLSGLRIKPGAESFTVTPVALESSEVPA
jgi:phage host-nuclease inhibitor protein Gam